MINKLFDLTNRTAIITGGTGMLGTVYTATLLFAKAHVVVIDKQGNEKEFFRRLEKDYEVGDNITKVKVINGDVTRPEQVHKALEEANNLFGNIKILINNASLVKQVGQDDLEAYYKPFLKMTKEDWEPYLSVDITGSLIMCQKVIPYMQKNGGGCIVNVSSTYGILSPDQRIYKYFNDQLKNRQKANGICIEKPIGYSVSKSGILNLTRHLATQFARYNIRINTFTPGGVYTNNPEGFVDAYADRTPLGRMADKNEYAGPILFLVSDASSYMTGANLVVDGGWSAW